MTHPSAQAISMFVDKYLHKKCGNVLFLKILHILFGNAYRLTSESSYRVRCDLITKFIKTIRLIKPKINYQNVVCKNCL